MKIILLYGSENDKAFMQPGREYLDEHGLPFEEQVLSAHRDTDALLAFLDALETSGEKAVILAIAGLSAALPGLAASRTTLPVIGVPVPGGPLQGVDALLSIVQCPGGVPAVSVGLHKKASLNACIFAHRLLAFAGETA